MKVYVVTTGAYDELEVDDVYLTLEAAQETYPTETWTREENFCGTFTWNNGNVYGDTYIEITEFEVREKPKSTA